MIQEIITYLIIGSAVTIAIIKFRNRFMRKKLRRRKNAGNNKQPQAYGNCASCSAECMMRNSQSAKTLKENNLCGELKVRSDSF